MDHIHSIGIHISIISEQNNWVLPYIYGWALGNKYELVLMNQMWDYRKWCHLFELVILLLGVQFSLLTEWYMFFFAICDNFKGFSVKTSKADSIIFFIVIAFFFGTYPISGTKYPAFWRNFMWTMFIAISLWTYEKLMSHSSTSDGIIRLAISYGPMSSTCIRRISNK